MKKKANKKIKKVASGVRFPMTVLNPVGNFLSAQLHRLQRRKKEIAKDDPFKDNTRLLDNASPDTDAAEQFGHARASALQTEINRKIIQTRKALSRIRIGKYGICEDCGKMIDTDRLMVYPEATLCKDCSAKREK